MSKWKQAAVLLCFLGGLCLSACGKDEAEQTDVGIEEEKEPEEVSEAEEAAEMNLPDIEQEIAEYRMHFIELYTSTAMEETESQINIEEMEIDFGDNGEPATLIKYTDPSGEKLRYQLQFYGETGQCSIDYYLCENFILISRKNDYYSSWVLTAGYSDVLYSTIENWIIIDENTYILHSDGELEKIEKTQLDVPMLEEYERVIEDESYMEEEWSNLEEEYPVEFCQRNYAEEQIKSNKDEKVYSDTWIKEHVMGVEFGYDEYVTQNDIEQIGQMQNLKQLHIHISREDEIDLSPLSNLTEIKSLNISIGGTADLAFLENMSQLEELYIEVSNEPIDLSPLGSLVHLRKLTMEAILAGSQDVSFLENLNQLRDVCIWKWCDLEDLSVFQNMSYLQDLRLSYVEDVDLNYLSECKNLKTLEIIGGNIRNAKGLTDLVRLEYLSLYDNNYYSDTERLTFDLHPLSEMIELKSVGLVYINVDDISPLSELKYLHSILLVKTGIGDIESLKDLEILESLCIYGNESEQVKEQAEEYFNELQDVEVTENIPNGLVL